ncbi:MAG: hypothetical protein RPG89_08345 [Microcystis panniformis WG22]|nr:hypothetical protein [Microcystis panniformis WG22]
MQTLKFEAEENNWVMVVFGGIALVANVGGMLSIYDILNVAGFFSIFSIISNNAGFFPILLVSSVIFLFLFWWGLKTRNKIVELKDGEGSLRKIWYKGINAQNKEVKSTQIFWKSNYRVWETYKIVGAMIDDRNNAIIEIEDDSLKSKLQTLGEVDLANQVQNTKVLMQALLLALFTLLRDQQVWTTKVLRFFLIIHFYENCYKQNLLNELINDLFKNLLNKIKNYSRTPKYNPPFYFNLDNGRGKRINNIPELLELCIDYPNKFKEHMEEILSVGWII